MTAPAAIQGQLVSIKNVSTHKSACLTIHVPEEYALKAIEAFGWPTMVNPVLVAIAKLDPSAKPERKGGRLAQKAGILCNEKAFWDFLQTYGLDGVKNAEEAADLVRRMCNNIASRAELDHDQAAALIFRDIELSYQAWLKVDA